MGASRLRSRLALAAAAVVALGLHGGAARHAAAQELRQVPDVSNTNTYRVRIESYQERRFRATIRQRYDFSCGAAAIATLLTYHYGIPTAEIEVFREMFERADQALVQREGFSLLDMQQYLARRGFQSNGYRAPLDILNRARTPAIALVNSGGYLHFVVVKGVRDGRVLMADPDLGMRAVDQATFEREWNGVLFVILNDSEVAQASFNRDSDWRALPRAPVQQARDITQFGPMNLGFPDRMRF
jgi:uncharacterized protein